MGVYVVIGPKRHILSLNLDYHLTARLADRRTSESGYMSDVALPIVLGVALAAATGFRVFLPMLIVSAARNSLQLRVRKRRRR